MKSKYYFLTSCTIICFLTSCALFKNNQKTTVTKTKTTIQKTPSGTTETNEISSTQISKVKINEAALFSKNKADNTDSIVHPELNFVWGTKNNRIERTEQKSDGHSVTDTLLITHKKELPSFEQKIIDNKDCNATIVHLTSRSSTYMAADYEAQGQHIFPGAIYYYEDFIKGNYKPLNLPRNPITLTCDLENIVGSTHHDVISPEITYQIRDGISALFSRFDNRQIGIKDFRYQTFTSDNLADYSMKISAGASYGPFSVENVFSNSRKKEDHLVTIDAIKDLYTITSELAKPFKNYLTTFQEISPNKHLIIISSVTYGVRILANFNVKTETATEKDVFNSKYTGLTSKAHVDFDWLSINSKTDQTINCYVVGGPGNASVAFDKLQLQEGIRKIGDGATYSNARPISFEIQDLNGNIIETRSETDNITIQTCQIVETDIIDHAVITLNTSDDNKNNKSHYHIYLKPDINSSWQGSHNDVYLEAEGDDEYPNNTSKTFGMAIPNNLRASDFQKGGSIYMRFWADNGHDTWKIRDMKIIFFLHSGERKILTITNFYVSDDEVEQRFFFDKDFNVIQ